MSDTAQREPRWLRHIRPWVAAGIAVAALGACSSAGTGVQAGTSVPLDQGLSTVVPFTCPEPRIDITSAETFQGPTALDGQNHWMVTATVTNESEAAVVTSFTMEYPTDGRGGTQTISFLPPQKAATFQPGESKQVLGVLYGSPTSAPAPAPLTGPTVYTRWVGPGPVVNCPSGYLPGKIA